jgi:Ca2+-transporting ATPase
VTEQSVRPVGPERDVVARDRLPAPTAAGPVGLGEREAARRLAADGPNVLPRPAAPPLVVRMARELREPLQAMLLVAAAVSGVVLGEVAQAVAILAVVVLNAVIALVEQGRAATALAAIERLDEGTSRVVRDGRTVPVPWAGVVVGDLLRIDAGDEVPADVRLVTASSLAVDESVLTGESLPVERHAGAAGSDVDLHRGSRVVRGSATARVVATGASTRLGAIAAAIGVAPPPTPLQRDLAVASRRIGTVALAVAGAALALGLARGGALGGDPREAFLAAVALAIAAVPEGLPTVTSVALALGVRRMAGRGALVRRLPAVETLGAATVLVVDKTGTLTCNELAVAGVLDRHGAPVPLRDLAGALREQVVLGLAVCNDATLDPPSGDPLEVALLRAVGPDHAATLRAAHPRRAEIPFDAGRRWMAVTVDGPDGPVRLMKGAAEVLLPRCGSALDADGLAVPLDVPAALAAADTASGSGARVLAVVRGAGAATGPGRSDDPGHDLVLVGMVALRDPVRPGAAATVARAGRAGIRVLMATGDHPGTAADVARAVGLPAGGVRTGAEIARDGLPDDPTDVAVYARFLPEQKLALVAALQARGEVVGMTGDGVNDAPALRRADIGVALGASGSDVARGAADLVVTDDDLATIVAAVAEGRRVHDDLRRVVAYLVIGNLAEVLVVVSLLVVTPAIGIPLLPLQLLWINLVTDGLPSIALGVDVPADDLLERPPRPPGAPLLGAADVASHLLRGAVLAAGALGAAAVARLGLGLDWPVVRTVLFLALIGTHLLNAYAVRWPVPPWRATGWLHLAVLGGALLQVPLVLVPAARELLGLTLVPPAALLAVLVGAVLPPLAVWSTGRRRSIGT